MGDCFDLLATLDAESVDACACLGWRIVPVTPSQVRSGVAAAAC